MTSYYLFDLQQLLVVMLGPAIIVLVGFLVFVFWYMPPQARAMVKAKVRKRVLLPIIDSLGGWDFKVAEALPEGQYQVKEYEVYTLPHFDNPTFNRPDYLKGSGVPMLFGFAGKTPVVPSGVLSTIEFAETPKEQREKLPDNLKQYAEAHHLVIMQTEKPTEEGKKPELKKAIISIFKLDARKLYRYFINHYDVSQYGLLLRQYRQRGMEEARRPGGSNALKYVLVIAGVGVIGVVVMLALARIGVLK